MPVTNDQELFEKVTTLSNHGRKYATKTIPSRKLDLN